MNVLESVYFKTSQNVTFNYYHLSLTCTTPVVVKVKDQSDVFLQYLEGNEMKRNETKRNEMK